MKKTLAILTASVTAIMICASTARAESLWSDKKGSMFSDFRAHKKGDILTVLVMESASSTQSATTDSSRSSTNSIGPGTGFLFKNLPGMAYGGTSTSNGDGSTNRTSNLVTTLAVTVTDVLDNGNLVIQGERDLQTNEETQHLVLTGSVRAVDVGPANTISSTMIADAKIKLTGQGPVGSRQKEGIFSRVLRLLF